MDPPASSAQLPIRQHAAEILKAVQDNDVVVVIGETGSGKTTQLSQVFIGSHQYSSHHIAQRVLPLLALLTGPLCMCRYSWRLAMGSTASLASHSLAEW